MNRNALTPASTTSTSGAAYTIQRSDQPGYTDRWFVYRECRPFRALLRGVDDKLVTFGSRDEAVAWLIQNPDALPELGDHLL